jgi:hypothetical protein
MRHYYSGIIAVLFLKPGARVGLAPVAVEDISAGHSRARRPDGLIIVPIE